MAKHVSVQRISELKMGKTLSRQKSIKKGRQRRPKGGSYLLLFKNGKRVRHARWCLNLHAQIPLIHGYQLAYR